MWVLVYLFSKQFRKLLWYACRDGNAHFSSFSLLPVPIHISILFKITDYCAYVDDFSHFLSWMLRFSPISFSCMSCQGRCLLHWLRYPLGSPTVNSSPLHWQHDILMSFTRSVVVIQVQFPDRQSKRIDPWSPCTYAIIGLPHLTSKQKLMCNEYVMNIISAMSQGFICGWIGYLTIA